MGKSLFEFAREKSENKNFENTFQKQNENSDLKTQFDKYSKYSQSDLQQELFSKVGEQKKNGEFNYNEIAKKLEQIKPMLSQDQIEKLNNLLKQIK